MQTLHYTIVFTYFHSASMIIFLKNILIPTDYLRKLFTVSRKKTPDQRLANYVVSITEEVPAPILYVVVTFTQNFRL